MPIFKSKQDPIDLPRDVTAWQWLFDSPASPLNRFPEDQLAGYVDAETKERVNWKQVKNYSTYISTALVKDYGFGEQQTLSLFSRNTIWYPVAMFAATRVGGLMSGASPAYGVDEMIYALKKADAKFLATSHTSIEVAQKAADEVGIPKKHIFLLEGELEGYTTIQQLIEMGKKHGEDGQVPPFQIPKGKTNFDYIALLSFSSGTTGLPKAVMIAHQNIIAQALQVAQVTPESHRKVLAVLPLFHITGVVHVMHLTILINAEVIMLPQFTMESMLSTVVEYQIQELLLVPPILIRLVRDDMVKNYDLSCIKRFSSGAAPLSEEVIQLLKQRFPVAASGAKDTGFKQGYGMTESCSCITTHPPAYYDFKYAHAVGTIVASTEVKILKDDGGEAQVGEPGEILARGPQVVPGYLNNEEATRETFDKDGFLHTGDQGAIDEEGMIHILDRIKEMIKVKGIGVAPAELEDLLLGHDKVEDVACMSMADDYSGERPKAYVTLRKGVAADEQTGKELFKYVQENKVRDKWVKEIEFIDEVPKSASGKILRRILKDMAKKGQHGTIVKAEESEKAKL